MLTFQFVAQPVAGSCGDGLACGCGGFRVTGRCVVEAEALDCVTSTPMRYKYAHKDVHSSPGTGRPELRSAFDRDRAETLEDLRPVIEMAVDVRLSLHTFHRLYGRRWKCLVLRRGLIIPLPGMPRSRKSRSRTGWWFSRFGANAKKTAVRSGPLR